MEAVASRRISISRSLHEDDLTTVPAVSGLTYPPGPPRISWGSADYTFGRGMPTSIWKFISLARASDQAIVAVARSWGPLGICVCGKPVTHSTSCRLLGSEDRYWLSREQRVAESRNLNEGENWEPLGAWRGYARQFSSILKLANAASEGKTPGLDVVADAFGPRPYRGTYSVQDGSAFDPATPAELTIMQAFDPKRERHLASRARVVLSVSRLIQESGIHPELSWWTDRAVPHLELTVGEQIPAPPPTPFVGDLFARLVVELVATVQRADGFAHCEDCGEIVESPTGRKLRSDGIHYCDDCRPKAKLRRDRERKAASRANAQPKSTAPTLRTCLRIGCQNPLPTDHKRRLYCSETCKVRAHQARSKRTEAGGDTPTLTPTPMNASEPS